MHDKHFIIKIGSSSVNLPNIAELCKQVAQVMLEGFQPVIVTSGAVELGKQALEDKAEAIAHLPEHEQDQVYASFGWTRVVQLYQNLFKPFDITVSSTLLTKDDFDADSHENNFFRMFCGNMCIDNSVMLINENDATVIDELTDTDNDKLTYLLAKLLSHDFKVSHVIYLTDENGVYSKHPREEDADLIKVIDSASEYLNLFDEEEDNSHKQVKSRGGMKSKDTHARLCAKIGIPTYIANAREHEAVTDIVLHDKNPGTKYI